MTSKKLATLKQRGREMLPLPYRLTVNLLKAFNPEKYVQYLMRKCISHGSLSSYRSLLLAYNACFNLLLRLGTIIPFFSHLSSTEDKKHAMSILLTLYPKSNKITSKKKEWNLTLKLSSSFLRRSCR